MLKVWGRRNSFNVQKVMWLIGELDLPHEHINAGGSFGLVNEPAFLAMNPHGRVPVIADDGSVIWESHAILRYLAATYGAGHFWQADAVSRSQWDRWMAGRRRASTVTSWISSGASIAPRSRSVTGT